MKALKFTKDRREAFLTALADTGIGKGRQEAMAVAYRSLLNL